MLVAGPEKRPYHLVLHERPDGWDITAGALVIRLTADIAFRDVDADSLAGMVITGRRAWSTSATTPICSALRKPSSRRINRSRACVTESRSSPPPM